MNNKSNHLSQLELLQLHDNEMDDKSRVKALIHLAACNDCASAFEKLGSLSKEINTLLRPKFSSQEDEGQRESLQRLIRTESLRQQQMIHSKRFLSTVAYAALGLVALGLSSYAIYQRAFSWQQGRALILSAPDRNLTPGDAKPISFADICPAKDNDKDPPVSDITVRSVFKEYGISAHGGQKNFQVDYLISPQLGGTNHIRNLWPQPYEATIWNARVKDALEDRLHLMVCNGEIDLGVAQHAIATDWIGAYKLYFHTQSPVETQAKLER